jgi:enoyl-CoA hydratase/carnithine racemase
MQALLDALQKVERAGARAVLLKSGLRHFSAGADLSLFEGAMGGGRLALSPTEFLHQLEAFPLPVVAAVHGVCVGGGFEVALACDFIIAARSAKIGSVEATLGLNPLMGAIQRQVQRAGALRAKEMSMLGRRYDAETLERWNLVNRVVDDEHLDEAARAVAMELAQGPTVAHRITKELARIAEDQGVAAADAVMEEKQKALWRSEDLKIGMASLIKNGPGLARFTGR